jgi:repressor LexA
MLTRKQYELLMFINNRLQEYGVSPSFEEMKEALDLKSKSGIHRLITGLEERGFLRRLPHRARALEVVKLPENLSESELPARNRRVEAIRTKEIGTRSATLRGGNSVQLQLYGRIAAGTPIEALRDHSTLIEVPVTMLGKGDHYALEVEGDSMIEAGILDGDTVIIERAENAETGDIVVALVEGHEVTLKKIRKKGTTIALEPANINYETRIYNPEQINVQGRLVGLLRKY